MVEFSPHGGIASIRQIGRILRVEGGGATNVEGVEQYIAMLQPWVAELRGGPWAVLGVVANQDSLLTPDAEQLLTVRARTLSEAGRIAVGLVCPERTGSRVLIAQWQRIYSAGHCALQLFDCEDAAAAWLDDTLRAHDADRLDAGEDAARPS